MSNFLDIRCPKCHATNQIDIAATVWLRVMEDGTDADRSEDGNHDFGPDSPATCNACGFTGRLHDFEPVAAAFGSDTPKPKSPPDPEGMQSFIATIARMTEDGEEREGDAEPFIMENDDAVSTLNRLIEDARQILMATK